MEQQYIENTNSFQSLFSILPTEIIKKDKPLNERQGILKMFVDEINKERIGTKYKPVTGRGIAMKLSMLKTNQELYEFLSECRDYKSRHKSFGKRFFGGSKKQEWN